VPITADIVSGYGHYGTGKVGARMYVRWKERRRRYAERQVRESDHPNFERQPQYNYHGVRLWRREAVERQAVLVENRRDPQSRAPRQHIVADLGSLDWVWMDPTSGGAELDTESAGARREQARSYSGHFPSTPQERYEARAAEHRWYFWLGVRWQLTKLEQGGKVTAEQRVAVEAAISAVVPRPPVAELEKEEAERIRETAKGWEEAAQWLREHRPDLDARITSGELTLADACRESRNETRRERRMRECREQEAASLAFHQALDEGLKAMGEAGNLEVRRGLINAELQHALGVRSLAEQMAELARELDAELDENQHQAFTQAWQHLHDDASDTPPA